MTGAHDYSPDPRNADVLVSVNGALLPRGEASVSVFDSGFLLGDGVWEGLRVADGSVLFLEQHMDRLFEGLAALDMPFPLGRDGLTERLFATLRANAMTDGVHVRLMVTRGRKKTPYQGPRFTVGDPTVVIIAEHKAPVPGLFEAGLSLFTVHNRRTGPAEQDQKLNSHSKLNCILACIQADKAGADEALMLDPAGFVATCNSTHFFLVRRGELWTSPPEYCLGGITRANVLRAAREAGIPTHEKRFSLTDVYGADEAFCTGTFGGVTPVREVDGREIGAARPQGPSRQTARRLRDLYKALAAREGTPIPAAPPDASGSGASGPGSTA